MCQICKDWKKGKLTIKEAWRNLNELADSSKNKTEEEIIHYFEVAEKLADVGIENEIQ